MKFIKGNDEHEILLIDVEENELGKGYLYEGIASKLYEKDRVNYFIVAVAEIGEKNNEIRKLIVEELVKRAKKKRQNYPEFDARIYHCCFSNEKDNVDFYSSINGFKHDEGMHILSHNLENINNKYNDKLKYEIKENSLNMKDEIQQFMKEHSKIFKNSYSFEDVEELKDKEGFKNIAIYDQGKIISNVLLVIEEEKNKKYGWVEDMFVKEGYRTQGLGEVLINMALEYFKSVDLDESRLEVWSANKRAMNLYNKVGYRFLKETQSSIGMFI